MTSQAPPECAPVATDTEAAQARIPLLSFSNDVRHVTLPKQAYGTSGMQDEEWRFDAWASPQKIFKDAAARAGYQMFVLLVIVFQIFAKQEFVMDCPTQSPNHLVLAACEYTRAYVVSFPLLAVVIALVSASRMILQTRLFYEALRQRLVIIFEAPSVLRDGLLYFLMWDICHTMLHFLLDDMYPPSHLPQNHALNLKLAHAFITDPAAWLHEHHDYILEVKRLLVYYVTPTLMFVMSTIATYDTEQALLPLSKYVSADPASASNRLAESTIVPEAAVKVALQRGIGLWIPKTLSNSALSADADTEKAEAVEQTEWTSSQLFQQLTHSVANLGDVCADQQKRRDDFGKWDLAKNKWICKLLLDTRLQDPRTRIFQRAWYIFSVGILSLLAAVWSSFFIHMYWMAAAVYADGEYEAILSGVVFLVHMVLVSWVGGAYLLKITLPSWIQNIEI